MQSVKTPTLIMCGKLDWNVPVLNSEILYQSLKRLGVETQLVVYPETRTMVVGVERSRKTTTSVVFSGWIGT